VKSCVRQLPRPCTLCDLHYCPACSDSTCTCTHISQLPHFILIMRGSCARIWDNSQKTCASHSTDMAKTHIFRQFYAYLAKTTLPIARSLALFEWLLHKSRLYIMNLPPNWSNDLRDTSSKTQQRPKKTNTIVEIIEVLWLKLCLL